MVVAKAGTAATYKCAVCGRTLRAGRWIVGRDRRITGKTPRYCYPGEGCEAPRRRKRASW